MRSVVAIEQDRASQLMTGWSLSILLHGSLLLALLIAMPKLTKTLEREPAHVQVALVEAPAAVSNELSAVQPTRETVSPTSTSPKPAPTASVRPPVPTPQVMAKQVQQETPQAIQREAEPVQRVTQTVQREAETVQREAEPVQRQIQPVQRETETVPRERVQLETQQKVTTEEHLPQPAPVEEAVTMPLMKSEVRESQKPEPLVEAATTTEAAREAPPLREQVIQQATAAASVPVETRETQAAVSHQPVVQARPEPELMARAPAVESPPPMPIVEKAAPTMSVPVAPSDPTPMPASPAVPAAIEQPPAVPAPVEPPSRAPASDMPVASTSAPIASAPSAENQPPVVARSVTPTPGRKADYGWLAESLHRRIGEVRHYPSAARLNGWEGRVVLRVAIRQDGNLESVAVTKSSGHESLDNAAMEAVRRACPLHLKHELTTPLIVVQVPINYSLNR